MSNPTELPDLDRDTIREVFLRNGFTVKDGQADLKPYVYAAAAELVALARRAQPEGEDRCVICGSTEPRTGTCGSDDPRALCKAPAGKPEGEAPQATFGQEVTRLVGKIRKAGSREIYESAVDDLIDFIDPAAATLSPLCGAQHAESGKEADKVIVADTGELKAELERAKRALVRAGFQDLGGVEWKPPLGKPPRFVTVGAQQAAAPGKECDTCNGRGQVSYETSGSAEDGNAPVMEPCPECAYGQDSAPGTPEAPKPARPKRLSEEEVRELALQHLHDDTESAGRNSFFTFSAEGLDGFAIDLMDRAAQLDGGQEGSESNG